MAIADDFTIDTIDRKITHSANNNTYTVQALYSWLQNEFDQASFMDDPIPMSAQTPNEFTMINGWFIDEETCKFLSEGAIQTTGWDAGTENDGIRVLYFGATYTNAVVGDIGREVGYAGGTPADTGTLLYYNNTEKKWYVRVDDTGDTFANVATGIDLDDGVGTGDGTLRTASITGEELYPNIYSIGTIAGAPYPLLYVERDRAVITNDREGNDWWAKSDGHFDILVKVKEGGAVIDSGNIAILARQASDLYDHYEVDLSSGGRNPAPLATSTDLNDTKPEFYLFYDTEQNGGFAVGDFILGVTSEATAEVIYLDDWGTEGCLGLSNVKGTFQDAENLSRGGGVRGVANGTVGNYYLEYDNEVTGFTVTDVVIGASSGASGTLRGLQDDGAAGKLALEMASTAAGYFDYTDGEDLEVSATKEGEATGNNSRAVDAMDNIIVAFCHGTMAFNNGTDEITAGQILTGGTSAATGIVMKITIATGGWGTNDAAGTITMGNVVGTFQSAETITTPAPESGSADCNETDGLEPAHTVSLAMEQQSGYNYDVMIFCQGRYVADVYEFVKYFCREDSSKPAYSYESRVRDIYFQAGGYVSCVETDVGLPVLGGTTTDGGTLLAYNNGTRIWTVLLDDPLTDLFDQSETVSVTGGTGTGTTDGCSYIDPMDGQLYKIAYSGYAQSKPSPLGTFAGGIYFGAQGVWLDDMHADDVQNYQLIDSDGDTQFPPNKQAITVTDIESGFQVAVFKTTAGVAVDKSVWGIKQAQGSSAAYVDVDENIATNHVDTPSTGFVRVVRRTAGGAIIAEERYAYTSWATDRFVLSGVTTEAYGTDDTVYVGFIDDAAVSTEIATTVIFTSTRNIVVRVRKYGYLPFELATTFPSTGRSVAGGLTPDTIVT